jgi:uncharacterized membrane protein
MVLELKVPHGDDWHALASVWPVLTSYVLSFIYLGIYWNNHHHMLHLTSRINGRILWTNLHLLFWLSLIPFTTRWMGENHYSSLPTAVYGVNLLMAGLAFMLLERSIIASQGNDSALAAAVGEDWKGIASAALYAAAIPLAFVREWIADGIYVVVAMMWFVPDPRIESRAGI